ncbi:MAG: hotdog fold thioesterase [Methanomicrobiales archaeon]|nr:hotdog fold thioesterase [Methanomicrobiales archaeon]
MESGSSFLKSDPFAQELGIVLESSEPGHVVLSLEIRKQHLNAHNTVHGGVIYTLADEAFAVACNTEGVPSVAINTSITYIKAAKEGKLIAMAREFSKNSKLGSYVIEVIDQDDEKIAIFQGLAYKKRVHK